MTSDNEKKTEIKRLYLSSDDKKLSGVCGGIAEYFNTDPTLIRLAYVAVTIVTGIVPGVLGYIIASAVIPEKPSAK